MAAGLRTPRHYATQKGSREEGFVSVRAPTVRRAEPEGVAAHPRVILALPPPRKYGRAVAAPSALSLDIRTSNTQKAVRGIERLLEAVEKPRLCLVAVTTELVHQLPSLVDALRSTHSGVTFVFAASTAVFTERGEFDGTPGLVALACSPPELNVQTLLCAREELPRQLARQLTQTRALSTLCLIDATAAAFDFHELSEIETSGTLIGAIIPAQNSLFVLDAEGAQGPALGVSLGLGGLGNCSVATSCACRLVCATSTVTRAIGSTVLEIDHLPALGWLERTGAQIGSSEQLHLVLVDSQADPEASLPLSLRTLRGIDPSQRALLLAGPVQVGTSIAIGVRDSHVARRNLERALGRTRSELAGSVPRFGFYFDDVGRGRGLYGRADVDLRMIRQKLGDFPLLGLRSLAELSQTAGSGHARTLSGLLATFLKSS